MKAKPVLTPDQAEVRFGAPAMSKALSVSGTNPLNTVALLGNTGFSGSFVVGGVTLVFETENCSRTTRKKAHPAGVSLCYHSTTGAVSSSTR